jgi:hypothetical protein
LRAVALVALCGCRTLLGLDDLPPDGALAHPDTQLHDAGPIDDATDDALALDDAGTPAPFALTGVGWLLPCSPGTENTPHSNACHSPSSSQVHVVLIGAVGGARWHVTARVRGVMAYMAYTGGTAMGDWYVAGQPGDASNDYFELTVSSPAQHIFINAGNSDTNHSWVYDEMVAFDIDANAAATFTANAQDGLQWMGVDALGVAISIPGITDPQQPYDGQFARLDVATAVAF